MTTAIYIIIFILGLMFGSFSSVLISRLKTGEGGIMNGRSHCPKCNHVLGGLDLIPVFSYLFSAGKCKYCKEKISILYPFLEIVMGLLFFLSTYFLIDLNLIINGSLFEILKLVLVLFISFIAFVLTVYDILYLEIHDGIMGVGIAIVFIALIAQTINPNLAFFSTMNFLENPLNLSIYAIIVSSAIIGILYTIIFAGLKEIYDLGLVALAIGIALLFKICFNINFSDFPILWGTMGALGLFIFFFLQIFVSKGAWMGAGDLRIAIFMGLILGGFYTLIGGFLTYLIGSVIGILIMIASKLKGGQTSQLAVPFGPFLAIGLMLTLYFQADLEKVFNMIINK
ncbi:MAG: prepilin peptidase [Candidatus Gracilibacteria bacterium]|nr:prepilin peptidase [Candidatus Gracilibacteria bacterium]